MGGFPSHNLLAYQTEGDASSDTDHRGSLRLLTGMLTRQTAAKKHRGKLLVLGLDGAGKSTVVNHLSRVSVGDDLSLYTSQGLELPSYLFPEPTRALQTASFRMETSDKYLQLVDPPGRRTCRAKWYSASGDFSTFGGSSNNLNNIAPVANTFQTALPVVAVLFIVNATDPVRFPLVAMELVRFLKHKTQHKVFFNAQLFLVLNKIDQFLPPLPAETPEEPQSREYQQLLNNRKQLQRSATREARRELRKCVDYAIRMDRRRHPVLSSSSTISSSSSSKSKSYTPFLPFATPAAVAAELGRPSGLQRNVNTSSSSSAVNSAASALFANVFEGCAQDRDSVRALRTWLNEELKRTSSS
ncbi:uncharacterized protein KRP23_4738 [Phytophthora ramorum]|uniref:uncharacterized protein n=1 Tax=Phytophthora ramorum TaxID=164328 RepID=UPI0030A70568|nr:hypothetical protein KRP23_4738 [Phytophthora ramorum]